MPVRGRDRYQTLGVDPRVSDDELRAAYRRLVQLHHPDHNGGSIESARRFEDIQQAYAEIRHLRETTTAARPASPRAGVDPDTDSRLADLERQIREAHAARERVRQDARAAAQDSAREAAAQTPARPSDEELGYIRTDDSFAKILADARSEIAGRFAEASEHPGVGRVADLIDELAAKLTGESPRG